MVGYCPVCCFEVEMIHGCCPNCEYEIVPQLKRIEQEEEFEDDDFDYGRSRFEIQNRYEPRNHYRMRR